MKNLVKKKYQKMALIFTSLGFLGFFFLNATYPLQTDFFVAPNGSDQNPGTISQPLLSLEKARDLAAQSARVSQKPVNVYLRSGTYFRETPLIFLPEHSGTSLSPIRFMGYDSEKPLITGALSVNGIADCTWSQPRIVNGLSIHRCTLKSSIAERFRSVITQIRSSSNNGQFAITSMFVASARRTRARHPNQDKPIDLKNLQMEINRPSQDYYTRIPQFFTSSTDWGVLSPTLANTGVELIFSNLWQHTRGLVTEVKNQDGRNSIMLGDLATDGSMVTFLNFGNEVGHLENHPSFIDNSGEWFFDEQNLAFEYIPLSGENFQGQIFQFPVNSKLIELKGASKTNFVQNIFFEKLKFQYSSWVYQNGKGNSKYYAWVQGACGVGGMIDGNFVKNIKVKHSQFSNFGLNAISLGGNRGIICAFADNSMAENIVISNNDFSDGGASAIRVDSYKSMAGYLKIQSNTVRDFGRVFEDAVAINVLSPPNYTVINSNNVSRGSYTGINAGWKCRNSATEQIIVENNRVEDVMKRLTDGGGIYNNGSQGFVLNNFVSTIGENREIDTKTHHPDSFWGVYLDDTSLFWNVDGNSFGSLGAASLMFKLALNYTPQTTHRISSSQISALSRYNAVATQADVSQCVTSNDGTNINRSVSPGSEPQRTTCKVTINDCPNYSHLAYREVIDSYEDADVDQDRCLNRAKDYYDYCAARSEVTARFMKNTTLLAEKRHINLTVPGAPSITSVSPSNAQVSASFSPPTFDGNSQVLGYDVQIHKASDLSVVKLVSGTGSPIVVTGLTNGIAYFLKIRAKNSIGLGAFSSNSTSFTPQSTTVPGVPTFNGLTAGNAQVTIAFMPPLSNGGSSITGYDVQVHKASDGSIVKVVSGLASPITITSLTNGTSFNFRIRAKNAVGLGAWSDVSTAVTPLSTNLLITAGGLTLSAGQSKEALNLKLTFQTDGHLVVTSRPEGAVLWRSNTPNSCSTGCEAVFQSDGNLVLRRNGSAYWASNTVVPALGGGALLQVISTSPFIRILDMQNVAVWRGTDSATTSLSFFTDQFFMYPGSDIIASGFQLGFTQDGRLIMYKLPGYAILWQTERNSLCTTGPCFAVFQSDANLVLYRGSPTNWSSVTSYWWANIVAHPAGSKITFQGTSPYVRITKPDGQQVYP